MVHVGFSGTRHGLTGEQSRALGLSLASLGDAVLHHGDAVGADAEAHEQAVALGWSVIIHPPINDAWRARKAASEERAPKPYLVRNRDIVDETELLVAAPADAVDLAAHRARTIMKGSAPVVDPDYDKNSVIALREIAEKVVTPNDMRERLIHSMQENVEIDESETTAAPRLPEISRPRLGRDDPSIDRKMDTMTEDALLGAMKSLIPEQPSVSGEKDRTRGPGHFGHFAQKEEPSEGTGEAGQTLHDVDPSASSNGLS